MLKINLIVQICHFSAMMHMGGSIKNVQTGQDDESWEFIVE